MKSGQTFRLWATLSLGMVLWLTQPTWVRADMLTGQVPEATTPAVVSGRSHQPVQPQTLLQALSKATVVYLGETHDRAADHAAQLEILQALHRLNPQLVIAMEMFQRPFQPSLDRYLAGDITETELLDRTQYKKRWGFPWEFYAPILRFAQTHALPVVALNTPTEVTRKVARQGLDSLTWADRRFIPPRSAISLGPESYRQRIQQIYAEIHQGKSNSANFERFFQAQILWDETMAERIAQAVNQHPKALVVVLVGQGHLVYGDGIPSRMARRLRSHPSLTQISVLLNPTETVIQEGAKGAIADYFWYSHRTSGTPER